MNIRITGLALFATAILVQTALADDLHPPPWQRFQSNTTSQEWVFNTPNLGPPDGNLFFNPNGTPSMQVNNPSLVNWQSTALGRNGVWSIFPGGILQFGIPNTPEAHDRFKEVWAQITWASTDPTGVVSLQPFGPLGSTVETIGTIGLGGGWFHSTFHYVLPFNPNFEYYQIINNSQSKLLVDQVVLDSICVPEPATFVALGLGLASLAVLRRRRK